MYCLYQNTDYIDYRCTDSITERAETGYCTSAARSGKKNIVTDMHGLRRMSVVANSERNNQYSLHSVVIGIQKGSSDHLTSPINNQIPERRGTHMSWALLVLHAVASNGLDIYRAREFVVVFCVIRKPTDGAVPILEAIAVI